jgi:hypothetical protein
MTVVLADFAANRHRRLNFCVCKPVLPRMAIQRNKYDFSGSDYRSVAKSRDDLSLNFKKLLPLERLFSILPQICLASNLNGPDDFWA